MKGLTSVGRVLLFDRRGTGTSDRVWADLVFCWWAVEHFNL
jgi:hypothetical protein